MKLFFKDIIPKIQRFSEKLDNFTLLTNQHWLVINEIANSKLIYIFRTNSDLLISKDGKVERGKWEYLGNNSILIDTKHESFLYKHGFFDENILALKLDGKDDYSLMVNETKSGKELNSIEAISEFLSTKYLRSSKPTILPNEILHPQESYYSLASKNVSFTSFKTDSGEIEIETRNNTSKPEVGMRTFKDKYPTPNGKYKYSFWNIYVTNGIIVDIQL